MVCPRGVSDFISRAGLGISSVGYKDVVAISYKPGEEVTEERVMKAIHTMMEEMDASESKSVIRDPQFIEIVYRNPDE